MPPPLRIGIAGLGTVGAAVIKLLDRQAGELRRRTGRQIALVENSGTCGVRAAFCNPTITT